MDLAKDVQVDRAENGAVRISIDGFVLPWYTSGIVTPTPSLDEMPTITITIPAEKVTMLNDGRFPRLPQGRGEISPGRWRCSHPGCLGNHTDPNLECC